MWQARRRYRATRAIIRGFDRLVNAKGARQFLRKALAATHRRAAEEHLQTVRDFEVGAALAKEDKRLAKLQKELRMVNTAVRKVVTKRLKRGWLSTARVVDATRGGGELQREIKAVREEWRALDAERDPSGTMNASGRNTWGWGVTGRGGGDGSFPSSLGFSGGLDMEKLNGLTWGKSGACGSRSERSIEEEVGSAKGPGEILEKETAALGGGGTNLERAENKSCDGKSTSRDGNTVSDTKMAAFSTSTSTPSRPAMSGENTISATSVSHGAEAAEREARRRIFGRDRELAREIIIHNFNVRNPPPLQCCAPRCGRTFTQDEHYLSHWAAGRHQSGLRPSSLVPETPVCVRGEKASAGVPTHPATTTSELATLSGIFDPTAQKEDTTSADAGHLTLGEGNEAAFHLILSNGAGWKDVQEVGDDVGAPTGLNLVSAYIARVWGHGQAHSTLLFWNAVRSWRRHLTTDSEYIRDAVTMRGLHLEPGALLEVRLPARTRQDLMRVLEDLPDLDDAATNGGEGVAVHVRASSCDDDDEGDRGATRFPASGDHSESTRKSAFIDKSSWHGKASTIEKSWHEVFGNRPHVATTFPLDSSAAAAAAAAAASAATPTSLRPTSFDEAQWHALSYLCKAVGPGFWASDFGRRAALLRSKDLKRERDAAHESVRLEVCAMYYTAPPRFLTSLTRELTIVSSDG